jgi:CRP/FNR family transcriptional regulator, cyclic AMP receptor protein
MLQSLNVARGREVEKICWEAASENGHKTIERPIPPISDEPTFPANLAGLPLVTYQAGETVIADGSRTGRLLILRKGSVAIRKEDIEIAKVAEPGAIFGELSILLDQPNKTDVCALETSQFHVADAAMLLTQDMSAILYVARDLARRLDGAIDLQTYRSLRWAS